ncbi:peptidylprolyl isomerase [Defluviimonas sp. WL0002]|uniref:Parvulin-like PPIase n=1 Tax=Albidovulum marisflavi TaxID=2984159 RepID=A0ABT2ZD56_9RHOB|nr:peptidylprolyl isomerase [Defluviimonas sp. WL0002]MCV2869075.1 peptidylprolyl isomerase [Defluviimonas sp. WL0002]
MGPLLTDITVNGEVIPAAAIAAEAQMHAAPKGKPGLAWRAAGRALAVRALLLQEARRRGLAPLPVTDGGLAETEDEALVRQLLDLAVKPNAADEAKARAAYDADPARWRAPTLYEAAHILFPCRPDDTEGRAQARARAEAALAELARAPRNFDTLARDLSACASRDAGGRLGQIATGDTVPEFEDALNALAEGEIAATPIATRYGYHIIRLDARAEGAILPYETVAPRIREMLAKAAWATAAREFVAALAARAAVSGIDLKAA